MQTSFYSHTELQSLGFKHIGQGCLISRKACFYNQGLISIGDNVRIDDFCILSGEVTLGSHIHISPYVALYGAAGIEFKDYTGISAHSTIYSEMDDFSGDYLVGSIHAESKRRLRGGRVTVSAYAHIGAHCLIFPDLTIAEGCVIGACSMLRKSTEPWGIYFGIPAARQRERSRNMLTLPDEQ